MSELLELTTLPEWSDFFSSLCRNGCLRMRWREHGDDWFAQVYEHTRDPSKPLAEEDLGPPQTGPDKFEVMRLALEGCGREIKPYVWEAFYAFQGAATGHADDIEDLL